MKTDRCGAIFSRRSSRGESRASCLLPVFWLDVSMPEGLFSQMMHSKIAHGFYNLVFLGAVISLMLGFWTEWKFMHDYNATETYEAIAEVELKCDIYEKALIRELSTSGIPPECNSQAETEQAMMVNVSDSSCFPRTDVHAMKESDAGFILIGGSIGISLTFM